MERQGPLVDTLGACCPPLSQTTPHALVADHCGRPPGQGVLHVLDTSCHIGAQLVFMQLIRVDTGPSHQLLAPAEGPRLLGAASVLAWPCVLSVAAHRGAAGSGHEAARNY